MGGFVQDVRPWKVALDLFGSMEPMGRGTYVVLSRVTLTHDTKAPEETV